MRSGGSLPLLPRPTAPPKEPSDLILPRTVLGQVARALRPGCLVLVTDDRHRYVLVGAGAEALP